MGSTCTCTGTFSCIIFLLISLEPLAEGTGDLAQYLCGDPCDAIASFTGNVDMILVSRSERIFLLFVEFARKCIVLAVVV